jgi:hypothetical protein
MIAMPMSQREPLTHLRYLEITRRLTRAAAKSFALPGSISRPAKLVGVNRSVWPGT